MELGNAFSGQLCGHVEREDQRVPFRAIWGAPYSLAVDFPENGVPAVGSIFKDTELKVNGQTLRLGRAKLIASPDHPSRRVADPPAIAPCGMLVFLDEVYDFSSLFTEGNVVDLGKRVGQLGVMWNRKNDIRPSFRQFTADLLYDLQVYRSVFDAIDRNLEKSPYLSAHVQQAAIASAYPGFKAFLDRGIEHLEKETQHFSRREHERHGFYFRKHLWDVIMTSELLRRTNLKPRGYAGDSVMMRMIYEKAFVGPTIFAKMMHYHPVEQAAAEAVRGRAGAIAERVLAHRRQGPRQGPFRLMSVACGPAWELRGVLKSTKDTQGFEITLLDQDAEALAEAASEVRRLESSLDGKIAATFVRNSVRTMLAVPDLTAKWGQFDCIYSMGLFDYLAEPVARVVLRRLYDLLVPGGLLVIGNFHTSNPSRTYMEYWGDWALCYRDEREFTDLAQGLDGGSAELSFDPTGIQMFLSVRKLVQ